MRWKGHVRGFLDFGPGSALSEAIFGNVGATARARLRLNQPSRVQIATPRRLYVADFLGDTWRPSSTVAPDPESLGYLSSAIYLGVEDAEGRAVRLGDDLSGTQRLEWEDRLIGPQVIEIELACSTPADNLSYGRATYDLIVTVEPLVWPPCCSLGELATIGASSAIASYNYTGSG